ncbi:hypothetical protein [Salinibacter sp.]|uniref:hypothetical protein n=1 Tax=Salinibacter sp. TaxID=2065818 RepID=UPI0021E77626|nr:hypothetical protein [Salinibacter sp.]
MFTFSRAFAALLLAGLLVLAGCDSSDSGMDDQQTQEPSVERSVTFNTQALDLTAGDTELRLANVPASRPNRAIGFNPGIAAEGLTGDSDRTLTYDSANNELTIEGTWTREEGDAEGLSSARAPAGDASIEPAGGIEFVTTPAQMAQRIVDQNIQPGGDTPFSLNHHTAENLNGEMRGQIVATQ